MTSTATTETTSTSPRSDTYRAVQRQERPGTASIWPALLRASSNDPSLDQTEAGRRWQQHVNDVNAMLQLTFQQSPLASAAFFETLAQDLDPFPGPALGCMPVSLIDGPADECDSEASRELSLAFMEALSCQGLVPGSIEIPFMPSGHAAATSSTSAPSSAGLSSQGWGEEEERLVEKLDHRGDPLPVPRSSDGPGAGDLASTPPHSYGSPPDVGALVGSFGEASLFDPPSQYSDSPPQRRVRRPVRIVRRPPRSASSSAASPASSSLQRPSQQQAPAPREPAGGSPRGQPHSKPAPSSNTSPVSWSPWASSSISPRRSHKKRAAPALVADQDFPAGRPQDVGGGNVHNEEAVSSCSNEDPPETPPGSEAAAAASHAPAAVAHPVLGAASSGLQGQPATSITARYHAQLSSQRAAGGGHLEEPRGHLDGADSWGRSPLHVAAASGQADAVQHLLHAGCDGRKWLPLDYRAFQYSAALQRAAAKVYSSRSSWPSATPPIPSPPGPSPASTAPAAAAAVAAGSRTQPRACLPGSGHWASPVTPDGLLCSALGLSLPAAEVDETFWHWGDDRERGGHALLAPLSFKHCTPLHLAAFYGHTSVVDVLLSSGACDPHTRNTQGCTALHMAAHQGRTETVAKLARADGCEIDAGDGMGRTALHHSAALGHEAVVSELWGRGCSMSAVDVDGWTALHHACQAGHIDVAAKLIIAGSPVQAADAHGRTPAHLAARRGSHEIVDKLLMAGYEVDALGGDCGHAPLEPAHPAAAEGGGASVTGCAVLHLAARHGHLVLVEKLLKAGADAKLRDCRGYTPLHCSAEGGHLAVFQRLLEASNDVTGVDSSGATLLHAAAAGGCWQIVDVLLQRGCNIDAVTREGCTVLHYAAFGRTKDVVERLLARGCKADGVDAQGNTPWHAAAESGNLEAVALFMSKGCKPDARNHAGWTALHFAARSGSVAIVDLLAAEGGEVGAATHMGDTPLQLAARAGHERLIARLLHPPLGTPQLGEAHVHAADRLGWTALHCACQHGSLPVVSLLLQAGAEVDVQSLDGLTPLHLAAMGRWTPVVARLLEDGASATLVDCEGCAPLHRAVRLADVDLFNALFPASASCLDQHDAKGWTVLHYAVEGGSPDIVSALLAACPGVAQAGCGGGRSKATEPATSTALRESTASQQQQPFTPLHLAAQKGHASLIAQLLAAGYHATDTAGDGRTPLHYAALGSGAGVPAASQVAALMAVAGAPVGSLQPRSHADAARSLLDAGAPPHALDSNGCSALHYAAGTGELDMVEQLLAQGVGISVTDKSGWTPLLWAASGGHSLVVTKLLEAGARVNLTDRIGRSVLHLAAEHGHADAVAILVSAMAKQQLDLHAEDAAGRTAVQVAAAAGHVEVVALVLESGQAQSGKGLTALHLAVQQGRDALVGDLLKLSGVVPNARDSDGLTALHWAASKGSECNVMQLVAAGCGVDLTTNDGWTALHEAAANGHTPVVQQLLDAAGQHLGANRGLLHDQINTKTANGSTALHNAATNGHDEIVRLLLSHECAVNARALSGATALYGAASGGNLPVVRRLLEAGAEVDAATTAGSTACAVACTGGHTQVIKALIAAGCDVDLQAQNGCTALHNAAGGGHVAVVAELLAAGCDVDIQNSHGNTALHVAASKGHLEVVEALLQAGADVHIKNSKAWAAVHSAAAAGHFEPVLRLIQHGSVWRTRADVDIVKMLMRKTSLKHSYVEGRLRLAEKERARRQARTAAAPGGPSSSTQNGPSSQELEQLEAQANANMAALLLEEASTKEASEKRKEKKKEKKKKKGKKASSDEANAEQSADEDGLAASPRQAGDADKTGSSSHAEADDLQPAAEARTQGSVQSESAGTANEVPSADQPSQEARSMAATPRAEPAASGEAQHRSAKPKKRLAVPGPAAHAPAPAAEPVRSSRPGAEKSHTSSTGQHAAAQPAPPSSPSKQPAVDLLTRRGAPANHPSPMPSPVGVHADGAVTRQPAPSTPHREARDGDRAGADPAPGWKRVASRPDASEELAAPKQGKAAASKAATPSDSLPAAAPTKAASARRERKPRGSQQHANAAAMPQRGSHGAAAAAPDAAEAGSSAPARGRQRGGHAKGREGTPRGPDPSTAAAVRAAIAPHKSPRPSASNSSTPGSHARRHTADSSAHAPTTSGASATPPLVSTHLDPLGAEPASVRPRAAAQPVLLDPQPGSRSPAAQALKPVPLSSSMQAAAKPFVPASLLQLSRSPSLTPPQAGRIMSNGPSPLLGVPLQHRPQHSPPPGFDTAPHSAASPPQLQPESSWGAPAQSGLGAAIDWSFGGGSTSSQIPRVGSAGSLAALNRVSSPLLAPPAAPSSERKVSSMDGSAAGALLAPRAGQQQPRPLARTLAFEPGEQAQEVASSSGSAAPAVQGQPQQASNGAPAATLASNIWGESLGGAGQVSVPPLSNGLSMTPPNVSSPLRAVQQSSTDGWGEVNHKMARLYGLTCPLTKQLMRDPVVAGDGYTYERAAIEAWLHRNDTSPITRKPLSSTSELVPNLTMRSAIHLLIPQH